MITEVEYIAKRPFKYNGETIQRGQVWEPTGARWDEKIIASGMVIARAIEQESEEKPRKSTRRRHKQQPQAYAAGG